MSGGCRRSSGRGAQNRVADPLCRLTVVSAERKALLGFRAVVRDDRPELIPIGLAVGPDARRVIKDEIGIRNRQPELPDPRHVDRQELLAELLGGLGLDPPVDIAILRALAAWPVHLHERPPPALEGLLDRRAL